MGVELQGAVMLRSVLLARPGLYIGNRQCSMFNEGVELGVLRIELHNWSA